MQKPRHRRVGDVAMLREGMASSDSAGSAFIVPDADRLGQPTGPLRVLVVGIAQPMETFIERLLAGLAERGSALTIMSPGRPPVEWLDRHGISWEFGPQGLDGRELVRQIRRNGPAATASTVIDRTLARAGGGTLGPGPSLQRRFDVIYAPWVNTLTERESLLHTGTPVVTSCRGTLITVTPWNPKRRHHREALPIAFAGARLVHCVSHQMMLDAQELGLDADKARVIRPAVDPSHYTPGAPRTEGSGPVRVISVGRLTWLKDIEHALLALRKAIDLGADLQLDIIGDGPEHQRVAYTIDDLGLTDRVRLVGQGSAEAVVHALTAADIFLHTSASEGISNAVLEGMASALPVVTTDAGGMREAVRDGIDGVVVPVRDSDAAGSALAWLAAEPEVRTRMGASGRARIEADFRLADQITAFDGLLHEAAGR